MNLILDTSILIELERRNKEVIEGLDKARKIYPAPAKIGFVQYFEFMYGLRKKSPKNKDKSKEFVERFEVLQTTKITAEILIMLKEKYELPLADLLIASQVLENKGILITKDRDFDKIKEIKKIVL